MSVTVLHKGLVIVALPLIVELLIIGALYHFLQLTDSEYALESDRFNRGVAAARLVFADCNAGALLAKAWMMRDPYQLELFQRKMEFIEELDGQWRKMPLDTTPELRAIQLQFQDAEAVVIPKVKAMGEVSANGFSFPALRKVFAMQKELHGDLKSSFGLMRLGMQKNDVQLARGRQRLNVLAQSEMAIVAIGFVLNLIAALWIGKFFKRNFMAPIRTIRENTTLLAEKSKLHDPIGGSDEIADLDKAFHQMSRELAAAAEREQALFNNTSDVICTISENSSFARINKAAEKMWGRARDQLIGKSVSEIIPPADYERAAAALQSSRKSGKAAGFETDLTKSDGTTIQMLWSAQWSDRQNSWYCTVHDITERRKLERLKESFLQLIAADFRVPLRSISELFGSLASGRFGELPGTVATRIDGAIKTLSRLVLLVDELLHLEQLQSRELRLERKVTTVRELLEQSVNDVSEIARNRRVEIEVKCGDLKWYVDDRNIVRVVVNLLSNAIKFSPEGGVITVEAEAVGKLVKVSVQDEGRGIPAEALGSLFQPFKQVKSADGKRGKGTGLGLVICKRIVEQHGGEIKVESQENVGSTFSFAVPAEETIVSTASDSVARDEEAGGSRAAPTNIGNTNAGITNTSITTDSLPGTSSVGRRSGNIDLKRKSWILISVPLLFEMVFVLGMLVLLLQSGAELSKQMHERDVTNAALHMALPGFELAMGLNILTTKTEYEQISNQVLRDLRVYMSEFKKAIGNKPEYARVGAVVLGQASDLVPLTRRVQVALDKSGDSNDDLPLPALSRMAFQLANSIGAKVEGVAAMCSKRERLSPAKLQSIRKQQGFLLLGGLVLNVMLAVALALYFSVDIVSRLRVLSDNSRRLSAGQPLIERVSGTDEIAELDVAFHDMAQRLMEAREKESAFLDNSQDIICALDEMARFIAVNKAVGLVLGVSAESLINMSLYDMVPASQSNGVRDWLAAVRSSGQPGTFETVLSGAAAPVDVLWSVSWSDSESSFFCVVHDISHRKELERIKQEFLAVISHDLRSPLTTIVAMVGLMQGQAFGPVPEKALEILAGIKKESAQIIELVDDLLDIEKLEAGQMQLKLVNADLNDILGKALEIVAGRQPQNKIRLEVTTEIPVNVDLERLSQSFANILLEASTYSVSALKVSVVQDGDSVSVVAISEGSAGKLPAVAELVDRINSSDAAHDGEHGGSRLRLPLARRILQSHHGELLARVTESGDIAIEVKLPRAC